MSVQKQNIGHLLKLLNLQRLAPPRLIFAGRFSIHVLLYQDFYKYRNVLQQTSCNDQWRKYHKVLRAHREPPALKWMSTLHPISPNLSQLYTNPCVIRHQELYRHSTVHALCVFPKLDVRLYIVQNFYCEKFCSTEENFYLYCVSIVRRPHASPVQI